MLPSYAHATLGEFKADVPMAGTGQDALAERALGRASRIIDNYLDRRVVFRAPTEDDDSIVASVAVPASTGTTALSAAGQPNSAGRIIVVTIDDAARVLIASGVAVTLVITGTVGGVAGTTETFDLSTGVSPLYGLKFFTAVSARDLTRTGTAPASGATIKVGTSVGYTEYHTPKLPDYSILYPREWPLQNVLTVHEDASRVYGADTLLVADTDYLVSKGEHVIARLSTGTVSLSGYVFGSWGGAAVVYPRRSWVPSWRATKVIGSAGYFGVANVPTDIKDATLRLAARIYQEITNKRQDVMSLSDGLGNVTRFGPAALTDPLRRQLYSHRLFHATAERDFDLEAA